jgi:hypothetical protein
MQRRHTRDTTPLRVNLKLPVSGEGRGPRPSVI